MQTLTHPLDATVTHEVPTVPTNTENPLPPAPLIAGAPGEACPKCSAAVAADQRYCVGCGERIGEPRLPFMDGRTPAKPSQPSAPAYSLAPYGLPPVVPKNKWSSGIALLSTIGVLLLAMGVGVLIGDKSGGDSNTAVQQPVIIGAAGVTSATAGATGSTAGTDKSASASSTSDADGNTKSGVDANALAKKNGVKLAPPTVDLGADCPKGSVGCDDQGKFTGDYFK